jgi:hypothetical protein
MEPAMRSIVSLSAATFAAAIGAARIQTPAWRSTATLTLVLLAALACFGAGPVAGDNLDAATENARTSDDSSPEPLSVLTKLMELETVGDVKAALSLFADDAIIVNVVGLAFAGQGLKLFVAQDIAAHDQFMIEEPRIKGDKVAWTKSVTGGFYATLGVAPVRFAFEAKVGNGKIQSIVAYVPASEIARIEKACRAQKWEPLIYEQPCDEFVRKLKAHTQLTLRNAGTEGRVSETRVAAARAIRRANVP